ncbi:MAG TPA: FAD binding domain-containing protein [Streptosporangiaceae bacterium]|nr:FAD binding domain-containing protein [Streptosporangiaceae bacterium]
MEFRQGTSVEQVLGWLADLGDSACVVAGGTDAMMQYARGEVAPAVFVHIERLRVLAAAGHDRESRLGALLTHRFLARDPVIRQRHPALAEAAATVGGWQTQAVGTVGGNICNASPAADTAAPLLIADAVVELSSCVGRRRVPLTDFFLGRRQVDRRPGELVTGIAAAPIGPRSGEVYLKTGRRGAMVVAVVGLAARLSFDEEGRATDARLAMCSVAPQPVRARKAEYILTDGGAFPDAIRAAGLALRDEMSPIDDSRATASYRREILPGLLERAVACCRSRAGLNGSGGHDC